MGKECGAWVSRRLWGGGNTSPVKTTAWEAIKTGATNVKLRLHSLNVINPFICPCL